MHMAVNLRTHVDEGLAGSGGRRDKTRVFDQAVIPEFFSHKIRLI